MPTPDARKRVMVVVLDANLTDAASTNVRNGIRMFHGVNRVVPRQVMPDSDDDLIDAIRQDVMGESYERMRLLEQQNAEMAARIQAIQDVATGGVPAQPHERDDPLRDVPLWTRKDKSA